MAPKPSSHHGARLGLALALCALVGGCDVSVTTGASISSSDLEQFFSRHSIDENPAAALKKRSVAGVSYLATVHGYPDNLTVCNDLIAPYDDGSATSRVPGLYYCELLRR